MKPVHERPCAAPGLVSYRYWNGAYGWVMIGARDDADALREAARSITGSAHMFNLWVWSEDKDEYVRAQPPTEEQIKAVRDREARTTAAFQRFSKQRKGTY